VKLCVRENTNEQHESKLETGGNSSSGSGSGIGKAEQAKARQGSSRHSKFLVSLLFACRQEKLKPPRAVS